MAKLDLVFIRICQGNAEYFSMRSREAGNYEEWKIFSDAAAIESEAARKAMGIDG